MQTKQDKIQMLKELDENEQNELMSKYAYLFENSCYTIKDNNLYRSNSNEEKYLGNFFIKAEAETIKDNGIDKDRYLTLTPICEGVELETVSIPYKEFTGQQFLSAWGVALRPAVGQTNLEYYRDSVKCQSGLMQKRVIYGHTGWRKNKDKWIFLHAGGALNDSNIEVSLDNRLSNYAISVNDSDEKYDTLKKLLQVAPKHIIYPLISIAFLSPLNEFFRQANCEPGMLLYLLGVTGVMKTTLASLTLCFFGDFYNKCLPASFKDTVNSLEKQAFLLKDVLVAIDDFYPSGNKKEADKMHSTAQAVSRSYGDRTGRGRMNADTSLRQSYYARGNAIITGEDLPNIGQSGISRNFIVEIKKGDVDKAPLTEIQENAEHLSMCMREFILWLAPNCDTLPGRLKEQFKKERDAFKSNGHGRTTEAAAHLNIAFEYFLMFLISEGALTKEDAENMAKDNRELLLELADEQNKRNEQEKPTVLFIEALKELIVSDSVFICDTSVHTPPNGFIGYKDELYYYLTPGLTYNNVLGYFQRQGRNFPISKSSLLNHLAIEGLIYTEGQENTKVRKIRGKPQRFIWLKASVLENDTAPG